MKDFKEIHEKPNESFDWDLATSQDKTRCIKLYGLLACVSFIDERKGAAIGESCGGLQWI